MTPQIDKLYVSEMSYSVYRTTVLLASHMLQQPKRSRAVFSTVFFTALAMSAVAKWCVSRRLQLNADKTETIWFGSRSNLAKLQRTNQSLQVGSSNIQPSSVVRDLGVYLDSELSMKQHIAKTAAVCFYNIRRLRHICSRVGQEVTLQLVMAFITSRLDYCNSLLAGLPRSRSTLEPLQQVQNAAARLVFGLGRFDHVTPSLFRLHWLPTTE